MVTVWYGLPLGNRWLTLLAVGGPACVADWSQSILTEALLDSTWIYSFCLAVPFVSPLGSSWPSSVFPFFLFFFVFASAFVAHCVTPYFCGGQCK